MPELPDIVVFIDSLNSHFAGKKLSKITVVNGQKLKDSQMALSAAINGQVLTEIKRSGKEMRFHFKNGSILGLHLMLTGDIFLFEKNNDHKFTIVELLFEGGQGMALTDRMRNANVKLSPEDKKGIDALDLTFKNLKEIFNRKTTIKNIMLDQDLIRGIGNGYSDEILWEARVSPYSVAEAIPDKKIKELVKVTKKVLKGAIKKISTKYPGRINDEVKEFLKIHRNKTISPTGAAIIIDENGSRKTYYTNEQILYE